MEEADRKRSPEVIELLSDSSDDETPQRKKPASKKQKKTPLSENTKHNSISVATAASKITSSSSRPISTTKEEYSNVNSLLGSLHQARRQRMQQDGAKESRPTVSKTPSSSSQALSASKPEASKSKAKPSGNNVTFSVASYNIWFGPKTGPLHSHERMMALSRCLLAKNTPEKPLYFVGLQEVTADLWATLKPILENTGYKTFCQDHSGGYGVALAVLQTGGLEILQCGWQPYRSGIMARGFLYCRAQLPNSSKQVLFTTTHLESYVPYGPDGKPYTGSPEREKQIKELGSFIRNLMERHPGLSLAMISGDLNWDDERVRSAGSDEILTDSLDNTWKDTWFDVRERRRQAAADRNGKVKKKDEPTCYTYDGKESPMLGGNLRRRFDRILFRQQGDLRIRVDDHELIGKDPIGNLTWTKENEFRGRVTRKVVPVLPSDHFGLVVSLNAGGLD